MRVVYIVFALAAAIAAPAWTAEIIGSTLVSSKYGPIEIASPGGKWELIDDEGKQSSTLATAKLKTAIKRWTVAVSFHGIEADAGAATMQAVLDEQKAELATQGFRFAEVEQIRLNGKNALVLPLAYTVKANNVTMETRGRAYILEGEKNPFIAMYIVRDDAYEEATRAVDELMRSLRF